MRKPEQIIGIDALTQLTFEGYIVVRFAIEEQSDRLPKLPNCGRYLAEDNTGQWHYLNHANEWQTYQGPLTP